MAGLWRELSTASWVANTGIPLVLTVAAILLGFWTVRRQLHHDRLLLTAQNRAEAARTLGAVIVREARKPDHELGNSPYWLNLGFEGEERIFDAMLDANVVLGDLAGDTPAELEYVHTITNALSEVWKTSSEKRDEVAARGEIHESFLNGTIEACVRPYLTHLDDIGRTLMRWNGIGPLPEEPLWHEDDVPLPRKVPDWNDAMNRWWEQSLSQTHDYIAMLQDYRNTGSK